MSERLELQEILSNLVGITEPDGDRHVYFQPPPSVRIKYPAIVYKLKDIDNLHANDGIYLQNTAYEATVIDPEPDAVLFEKVAKLPYSRFDRFYPKDNLNHYVFTIYYD